MSQEYAGALAAFGDPVLDTMYARSQEARTRTRKEKVSVPERCPSCGNTRILTRGHVAVICRECHEEITRLATGRHW